MESTALARTEPVGITPMHLIEAASARGASIEQMQQLFDLKLRVEADEAKKAYVAAMTQFKAEAIRVTRDKENKQYGSMYTTLGNLVNTVTPYLSKHGLTARWDIEQSSGVKVTCIVTHSLGHSESVAMTCPPDNSGSKNPIQQIKSAITYAKACTFESICGLASTDANLDDDGNAGAPKPTLGDEEFVALRDNIDAAENLSELKKFFEVAYKRAQEIGDKTAMDAFIRAKDARKKAIA